MISATVYYKQKDHAPHRGVIFVFLRTIRYYILFWVESMQPLGKPKKLRIV